MRMVILTFIDRRWLIRPLEDESNYPEQIMRKMLPFLDVSQYVNRLIERVWFCNKKIAGLGIFCMTKKEAVIV